jgi:hypothetical protein
VDGKKAAASVAISIALSVSTAAMVQAVGPGRSARDHAQIGILGRAAVEAPIIREQAA